MNQLRFIRDVIYRLKMAYGCQLDIYQVESSAVNRATGKKAVSRLKVRVKRAIVLPSRHQREFYYDLTFIASNKNFTYGGFVDTTERKFIIDRRDLRGKPFDVLEIGQYVVYQGKRLDIKEVAEFEESNCYGLICKQSETSDPDRVIEVETVSDLVLADGASAEASQQVSDDLNLTDDASAEVS